MMTPTEHTGIYSTRIRLQEGEEKVQAEEKNERLLMNDDNSSASEELESVNQLIISAEIFMFSTL